jgi:aryl-alcohol dehydrogenase-like predicted oxidoreductase
MINKKPFGRTGHDSTRIIFGAAALSTVTQEEADQTLEILLKYGINHIDTASGYGESELRIGPWMKNHRNKFFLATKLFRRGYNGAKDQIKSCLERLQVSTIDLLQFHNLTKKESWDKVMGPDGALKAAIEAKDAGMIRNIGVTGHGFTVAEMHKLSLEKFNFAAVLLPYNPMMMQNQKYAEDFENLVKFCKERNVAVQTIKSLARRPWGDKEKSYKTWYEPFKKQSDIDRAIHWVLNREDVFLNSSSDVKLLPKILDAASRFKIGSQSLEIQEEIDRSGMEPIFKGRDLIL